MSDPTVSAGSTGEEICLAVETLDVQFEVYLDPAAAEAFDAELGDAMADLRDAVGVEAFQDGDGR